MTVVTRFPPSPTGFMHIGNARTALYNWLYAKRHGGKMLFRIEDTDRARHSEEAVLVIINTLKWLDLDWDGEIVSQFERRDRHVEVARQLLEKGLAYKCYCSPAELDEMRQKAREEGSPTFYDRRWRDKDASEAPKGVDPVIRIKAPLEGSITIKDQVQGEVTVNAAQLDDFIILRSDGTPTYMLSVVCDDHDMGVTHVIRGDDHLNNTFRQSVIYNAMEWPLPEYGHLPLILGPNGGKMSKREGGATVDEYRQKGYLPEAIFNYLLRLGWSHGDEEIISREQAIEWFDIENIGKSAAKFDYAKVENLNTHYIGVADNARLVSLITPFILERHNIDITDNQTAKTRLLAGMNELKSRAKTLLQLTDEAVFYCKSVPYEFDTKASEMLADDTLTTLQALHEAIEATQELTADDVKSACKNIANEHKDGKMGKVAMPLRAALTGTTVSPSIFDAAAILGRDECLARLSFAMEKFGG